jgi:predicted nucleic acid-binding protein
VNGGFLLDTNIPSELMRPGPEPKVQNWLAAQDINVSERGERRRNGIGIRNHA